MFTKLFEYYNISNYDTRPGAGISLHPDKSLGRTVGDEVQRGDIYDKYQRVDEDEDEDEELVVDKDSLEAIGTKLNNPVYSVDPKRTTVAHTGGNMRQAPGLNEESTHTTTAVKGISPRMTYRGASIKGPAFGTQSSAKYIRNAPGRKSGTMYGTSRAPIINDDDPLDFGAVTKDKHEISFLRQQKNINRIKNLIKEIEKDKFSDKSLNP